MSASLNAKSPGHHARGHVASTDSSTVPPFVDGVESPRTIDGATADGTTDLAAYERYWEPRRRRLVRRLRAVWTAIRERLPGLGGGGGAPPDPPWLEPALVPVGPRRGPLLSGSVALEPPDDDWDGDVVAYPKEID
jgi:hypothetical protein